MQTAKLKTYPPKARRDFIVAVTRGAAKLGLTAKGVSPNREEGQLVIIEGQPYPKSVGAQRAKLAPRIAQQGFAPVLEAAACTWFNRFAAIRYMELHGYLDHSFRVLSHPGGSALPEILEHAQRIRLDRPSVASEDLTLFVGKARSTAFVLCPTYVPLRREIGARPPRFPVTPDPHLFASR
jgi:hypothetical protein